MEVLYHGKRWAKTLARNKNAAKVIFAFACLLGDTVVGQDTGISSFYLKQLDHTSISKSILLKRLINKIQSSSPL